jgi:hypothetical protein
VDWGKGRLMLEWKTRILTLLVSVIALWDVLEGQIENNWNW